MPKDKKSKLGEGWSPDVVGKTGNKANELMNQGIPEGAPMAKTQIGGYDLEKEGGTKSLGRAMQENATKNAAEAALERLRKRNANKP